MGEKGIPEEGPVHGRDWRWHASDRRTRLSVAKCSGAREEWRPIKLGWFGEQREAACTVCRTNV